uniref:Secreted protein n=1 Tax=Stomoxys calcitrans TaxID=35570 RepID=A0A1I8PI97_STOCA
MTTIIVTRLLLIMLMCDVANAKTKKDDGIESEMEEHHKQTFSWLNDVGVEINGVFVQKYMPSDKDGVFVLRLEYQANKNGYYVKFEYKPDSGDVFEPRLSGSTLQTLTG